MSIRKIGAQVGCAKKTKSYGIPIVVEAVAREVIRFADKVASLSVGSLRGKQVELVDGLQCFIGGVGVGDFQ